MAARGLLIWAVAVGADPSEGFEWLPDPVEQAEPLELTVTGTDGEPGELIDSGVFNSDIETQPQDLGAEALQRILSTPNQAPAKPSPSVTAVPSAPPVMASWWNTATQNWKQEQLVFGAAGVFVLILMLVYLAAELRRYRVWRRGLGKHMICEGCGYPLPNRYTVQCAEYGQRRIFMYPQTAWGWFRAYRKQRYQEW